ncbi:DGQHR domain-containing protein DpdB [Sphingopyxis sp. JAI108]|uniref:DGQHR domain-containing protein DpdB n=1 Tax=Sphingopyxis sp. JAI108 TaxID=2723060 RepID=UPI0015CCF9BF|nr:DGQHR domain-containing protein DpdB [Sphingopyxis sp. JAI108]NYF30672.1 DGQHR domain-containing protein [Sphingopyxis sp. JAI108]
MTDAIKMVQVRATRAVQGDGVAVYSFFLRGADIARIADISRLERNNGELKGFQRPEIKRHVKEIVDFLDAGPALFPNAIILALAPDVSFQLNGGKPPRDCADLSQGGVLKLPILPEGDRVAWIVDGQQRSLALAQAKSKDIVVPVVGFESRDLRTLREQFILVNKVRGLSARLIDELLPEVGVVLPRDLAARKLPSALCSELAEDPKSPFYGLLRRPSVKGEGGVITDSALTKAIAGSLKDASGALGQHKGNGTSGDTNAMYRALVQYWSAVRDAFPDAWGKPPEDSRLMHSAGIRTVGALMDQIMIRADGMSDPGAEVRASLERIAPYCRWIEGEWDELGWAWNEVMSTPQHITRLRDHLMLLDRRLSRISK